MNFHSLKEGTKALKKFFDFVNKTVVNLMFCILIDNKF